MNKTRKRAIQKHRAKELKYEVRRKSSPQDGSATTAAVPITAKAKPVAAAAPKAKATKSETTNEDSPAVEVAEIPDEQVASEEAAIEASVE